MADFARILAAIDQVLGTEGFARFAEQARTMAEDFLSADPFLAAMAETEVDFTGTSAELLVKVSPDEDGWRRPRDWPKNARSVTSLLKRNAPALRKAGWVVEYSTDLHTGVTEWTVTHPEKAGNPSQHSQQSQQDAGKAGKAGNENGQSQVGRGPLSWEALWAGEPSPEPADPHCGVCGQGLSFPVSRQRGVCEKCHRLADVSAS
jgi:hypothetical protein